jgi:hypothetical protein
MAWAWGCGATGESFSSHLILTSAFIIFSNIQMFFSILAIVLFLLSKFWLHGLQGWVMKSMPSFIVDKAVMGMHAGIRKRGLKKDAMLAAEGKKE